MNEKSFAGLRPGRLLHVDVEGLHDGGVQVVGVIGELTSTIANVFVTDKLERLLLRVFHDNLVVKICQPLWRVELVSVSTHIFINRCLAVLK